MSSAVGETFLYPQYANMLDCLVTAFKYSHVTSS